MMRLRPLVWELLFRKAKDPNENAEEDFDYNSGINRR